jgi:pimeloyl-ACP methyl ester carboxylesterase
VAPDLMGSGNSPRWIAGDNVTLSAEAERIVAQLPPEPVHLVGHSYGGAVALEIALRWPDRVGTLSLYEPVRFSLLLADERSAALGESIVGVGSMIARLARGGKPSEAAAIFVDYWSGTGTWDRLPLPRRQSFVERMQKVAAEFKALFADDMPPIAYGALSMPMRLISGTRSPLPARRVVELLAARCSQAQFIRLDGMGHMAPVTHPVDIAPYFAFQPDVEPMARFA